MLVEVDSSPGSRTHFVSPPQIADQLDRDEMPVDYASYLLSASPPGFDLDLHYTLRDHFGEEGGGGAVGGLGKRRNGPPRSIMLNKLLAEEKEAESAEMSSLADDIATLELVEKCHCSADTVVDTDGENNELCQCRCQETTHAPSLSSRGSNHKLGAKKVSFADDVGLSLVSVRILTESTDTPPKLRPEILSTLGQGASAGVTEMPPLVLNFTQPASEYMAFREKIERIGVSLENVILKDYNLLGTIKVKNVAFEKNVTVRCTFDNWETSVDIPASFAPGAAQASRSPYDTFSFEISVPPTMDVRNKVHFAVCYESGCQQFWDNNDGNNYEVVSADWKTQEPEIQDTTDSSGSGPENAFSTADDAEQWSEFSAWRNVDQEVPYW